MFGRKKTEEPELKKEEPKTETIIVKGQEEKQKVKPNLAAMLWIEFARDYQGFFAREDLAHMPETERQALILDLLMAIYGELRLIRDASTKQE